MSFFLRLGCALLASVGIAAAHGAVSPDAAAAHPAQERLAAAPLDIAHEDAARGTPDASIRPSRSADHAVRTVAAASSGWSAAAVSFVRVSAPSSARLAASFRRAAASPRGPPASA